MRPLLYLSCTFLLLLGCQEITPVAVPETLLSQEQMEEVMFDAVLVKAARGYRASLLNQLGLNPATYIFEKYNIDSTIYAQNLIYYTADVDLYKAMNDRVLEKINTLHRINDSIASSRKKLKDSIRNVRSKELKEESLKRQDSLKKTGLGKKIEVKEFFDERSRGSSQPSKKSK